LDTNRFNAFALGVGALIETVEINLRMLALVLVLGLS
jgi:hypothetical protein